MHKQTITLALDGMGGDFAPLCVLEGANKALRKHPNIRFLLFGDEKKISPFLKNYPSLSSVLEIRHTEDFIDPCEKPAIALRKGRNSSMRLAINSVKNGEASAVISSGNTGALMAMSKFVLRMLPGIDRPAITAILPNKRDRSVILDLGANSECSSDNLYQFAIMGDAFAKAVLKIEEPSIAILNIGSEDAKGNSVVQGASKLLKETEISMNFKGFVEGDDIAKGTVDVIVTDGFSGNIALKTAEGTAAICTDFLRQGFKSSIFAQIGGFLAKRALKKTFKRIDHRRYNGAMLSGLNGVVIKSHGSADRIGFANAINVAVDLITSSTNDTISKRINSISDKINLS